MDLIEFTKIMKSLRGLNENLTDVKLLLEQILKYLQESK